MSFESELKDFIEELHRVERSLDFEKLADLIDESYIGFDEKGERIGKSDLIQQFKDPSLKFNVHEVSELEYRVYGEMGIVTGKVKLEGRYAKAEFQGNYIFTDVCVRRDGQWQVVLSQMTGIPS